MHYRFHSRAYRVRLFFFCVSVNIISRQHNNSGSVRPAVKNLPHIPCRPASLRTPCLCIPALRVHRSYLLPSHSTFYNIHCYLHLYKTVHNISKFLLFATCLPIQSGCISQYRFFHSDAQTFYLLPQKIVPSPYQLP